MGFSVPAALLVALVVAAVVRDRRVSARETAAEAEREAFEDQLHLVVVVVLFTVGGLDLLFGF